MKPIVTAAVVAGWLACGVTAAGFLNANLRCSFQDSPPREITENWSFFIGWGLLFGPLSPPASWVLTGGWQDGWTLSRAPVARGECE